MSDSNKINRLKISDYAEGIGLFESAREYYLIIGCFSVIHEIGHILFHSYRRQKDNFEADSNSRLYEEKLVIDFAASFWRQYGSQDFIGEVHKLFSELMELLLNSLDINGVGDEVGELSEFGLSDCLDWFEVNAYERFGKLGFGAHVRDNEIKRILYNMFQVLHSIESLNNPNNLSSILLKLTGIECRDEAESKVYSYDYNVDTPTKVIADATDILMAYGIEVPSIQYDVIEDYRTNSVEFLG